MATMRDFPMRLYGLLLRAYPSGFYAAYGPLMAQALRDGLREARRAGVRAEIVFWLRAIADLIVNVTGAHMDSIPFSRRPLGYLWHLTGVLVVAATWPLMLYLFLLCLTFITEMNVAQGGTLHAGITGVIGQPRNLMIVAMLILVVSSISLARASFRGQVDRWLAFRYALVNAVGSLGIVFTMWGLSQLLPRMAPADLAVLLLVGAFGLLLAGLFYAQHRACLPRWSHRQSASPA